MDPNQQPQQSGLPSYIPADPVMPSSSHKHRRRFVAVLIFIIIVVVGAAIATVVWLSRTNTNFQAYAPKVLPSGVSATSHKKSTSRINGTPVATVTINSNSKDFSINEQKSTQEIFDTTLYSCNLQLQQSLCLVYKSPAGTSYDVRTNYDSATGQKPISKSVAWLKDSTRFWINLQSEFVGKYPNESWGNVVDGFVPASYGSE